MAWKSKKPCMYPGCPELVPIGIRFCEKHRTEHEPERPSTAKRGYDSRWQKFRKWYMATHQPCWCTECLKEGRYVLATDLDHMKTIREHPELRFDPDNINPLCHSHHSIKTQREDRNPYYHY